jgi:hypothetical protein
MFYVYLNAVFLVYVLCQMLGGINAPVLSSCTSEREHQACKPSLYIPFYVGIGQLIDTLEKCQYFPVILKEAYYRLVKSCQLLVRLVASRGMGRAAVKDISAAIAGSVFRYAFFVRK